MPAEVRPAILLVDDQADVREALWLLLKAEGMASVAVALEALNALHTRVAGGGVAL